MGWLIFIDTNIFLDFYRMGGTAAKRQLEFVDQNQGRIIIGEQVQMEFLKNRQKVILDTIGKIKKPDHEIQQMPPILVEAMPAGKIKKSMAEINTQQQKIRMRIQRLLHNPSRNDDVYKCMHRICKLDNELNLSRTKSNRYRIRSLARKRWTLGYPPRKREDTSIGDALNWEWIVYCATLPGSDVMIVSRDGDYGATHQGEAHINDWLLTEFKQRVGKKHKLVLTPKLTDAMKQLNVKVTKSEQEAEEKLLSKWEAAKLVSQPTLLSPKTLVSQNLFGGASEPGKDWVILEHG